jgi:hypothetical protein
LKCSDITITSCSLFLLRLFVIIELDFHPIGLLLFHTFFNRQIVCALFLVLQIDTDPDIAIIVSGLILLLLLLSLLFLFLDAERLSSLLISLCLHVVFDSLINQYANVVSISQQDRWFAQLKVSSSLLNRLFLLLDSNLFIWIQNAPFKLVWHMLRNLDCLQRRFFSAKNF